MHADVWKQEIVLIEGRMKQELKSSSKRIGQLYPILVDYYGNIIDGKHRFSADRKWKTAILEHVKTEKDRLIARIISNTLRRSVSSTEKSGMLGRLGEIHLSEGITRKDSVYDRRGNWHACMQLPMGYGISTRKV